MLNTVSSLHPTHFIALLKFCRSIIKLRLLLVFRAKYTTLHNNKFCCESPRTYSLDSLLRMTKVNDLSGRDLNFLRSRRLLAPSQLFIHCPKVRNELFTTLVC